jgi:hypothetical protein
MLQLPGQDRQILEWYYYDRYKDVEIGMRLFPGQGTDSALGQRARKLRRRSLGQLRALLLKRGVDPEDWSPDPPIGTARGCTPTWTEDEASTKRQ